MNGFNIACIIFVVSIGVFLPFSVCLLWFIYHNNQLVIRRNTGAVHSSPAAVVPPTASSHYSPASGGPHQPESDVNNQEQLQRRSDEAEPSRDVPADAHPQIPRNRNGTHVHSRPFSLPGDYTSYPISRNSRVAYNLPDEDSIDVANDTEVSLQSVRGCEVDGVRRQMEETRVQSEAV